MFTRWFMMIPACFKHQTSSKNKNQPCLCFLSTFLTDLLLSHALVLVNLPIESLAWGVPRSSVVSSTGTSAPSAGRKIVILPLEAIFWCIWTHYAYNITCNYIVYIYIYTINFTYMSHNVMHTICVQRQKRQSNMTQTCGSRNHKG